MIFASEVSKATMLHSLGFELPLLSHFPTDHEMIGFCVPSRKARKRLLNTFLVALGIFVCFQLHISSREISKPVLKGAYATLLTSFGPLNDTNNQQFQSCRLLVERLRRTRTSRDVIVLTTSNISKRLRRILTLDGARVQVIDHIVPKVTEGHFLKLHLWNQTSYDRIMYLDPDVLPIKSLDHAFFMPSVYEANFEFIAPQEYIRDQNVRRPQNTKWVNEEIAELNSLTPTSSFSTHLMILRPNAPLLSFFISKIQSNKQLQKETYMDSFLNWHYSTLKPRLGREFSGSYISKETGRVEKGLVVHMKSWWLSKDTRPAAVRSIYELGIKNELNVYPEMLLIGR